MDSEVWDKLSQSEDAYIRQRMQMIKEPYSYFKWVDPQEADILIKFRCRAIDPWVVYKEQVVRLSMADPELAIEFDTVKKRAIEGWPIQLLVPQTQDYFIR